MKSVMHEHDRNDHQRKGTNTTMRRMTGSRTSATLSFPFSDAPIISTSAAEAPAFVIKTSPHTEIHKRGTVAELRFNFSGARPEPLCVIEETKGDRYEIGFVRADWGYVSFGP